MELAPAQRIQELEESSTLGMTKKARELASQGHKVISLSVGEPDFKTPAHICEAGKKAIDDGFHGYSPVAGYPDLRLAIANKLKRDSNLEWASENIVVSTGAKHSLANVISAVVNPGDEVIIFSPYWVSYSEMVKLAEGKSVIVEGSFDNNFKVKPEQFEAAITPKTKLVMFASPNNPTGSVYTESELREIGAIVAKNPNILVLADEIYEYINFTQAGHFSIGSIPEIKNQVITVNGVAKGHAMTGWRIGFMAGPKWVADAVEKLQGQVTSGTCSIAQKAATAAFNGTLDHAIEMKEAYDRRRKLVVAKLREIPGFKVNMPEGAFYAFPDISYYFGKSDGNTMIENSDDFCMWLLNEAYVATVAGSGFGAPNCMRISTAAADIQLEEACDRIAQAVKKLN
ncbi:MAG: Aspartate transaminase [Bacteroidota bacterium]|jgi:aspartate aminotransferase